MVLQNGFVQLRFSFRCDRDVKAERAAKDQQQELPAFRSCRNVEWFLLAASVRSIGARFVVLGVNYVACAFIDWFRGGQSIETCSSGR
ncbi:hypothetical protein PFISCL1PPCAC_27960, partial [Pristionchus fissidentatus]